MILAQLFSGISAGSACFLVLAIGLALAFEFVNGFHDTANAVATVIYTHTLKPWVAVIWSGLCNLCGVLAGGGAVAFTIVALLPVELVINVGSGAGFAMVFALLISAILWNLGTWYLGLPASSSHTLIGSIMGVGMANAMLNGHPLTDGVNWGKVEEVFESLICSPIFGFVIAGGLLLLAKQFIRMPELFKAPPKDAPPPFWIRCILVFTCTGVSFFHGSNDGAKGMGLILLILIGILPATYALNMGANSKMLADLEATSAKNLPVMVKHAGDAVSTNPQSDISDFIKSDGKLTNQTFAALAALDRNITHAVAGHDSLESLSSDQRKELRTWMYLESAAAGKISGKKLIDDSAERDTLKGYSKELNDFTQHIPTWVKVAVAMALGFGTMIGWKRIVMTVGEKIGKDHLTYAQGASAEIVAMLTIGAADYMGLPVSTTHVLSSGVAGTMAANHSGLQMATLRNLLMAWVLTLPVCVILGAGTFAAGLYIVLHQLVTHAIVVVGICLILVAILLFRRIVAARNKRSMALVTADMA